MMLRVAVVALAFVVAAAAGLYRGTCAHLDAKPLYPLANLQGGRSHTTLAVALIELTSGAYALAVTSATPPTAAACSNLTKL